MFERLLWRCEFTAYRGGVATQHNLIGVCSTRLQWSLQMEDKFDDMVTALYETLNSRLPYRIGAGFVVDGPYTNRLVSPRQTRRHTLAERLLKVQGV